MLPGPEHQVFAFMPPVNPDPKDGEDVTMGGKVSVFGISRTQEHIREESIASPMQLPNHVVLQDGLGALMGALADHASWFPLDKDASSVQTQRPPIQACPSGRKLPALQTGLDFSRLCHSFLPLQIHAAVLRQHYGWTWLSQRQVLSSVSGVLGFGGLKILHAVELRG